MKSLKQKAHFLKVLGTGLSVSDAARQTGWARSSVYHYRQTDEEFGVAWDEAIETGTDILEDEARRRAVEGCEENVYYQGKIIDTKRNYSDTLLIFLLKARRPEKYRERFEHFTPDKSVKIDIKTAYIEADGTRTDRAGNLIDEDYRLIDEDGKLINPALSGPAKNRLPEIAPNAISRPDPGCGIA